MKLIIYAIAGLLVLWTAINFVRKGGKMNKSEVKAKIDAGALIVDVRSPGEFSEGHYPKAINIPVDQIPSRLGEFGSKDKEIIVYCRSGGRSTRAKQILESSGFSKITNGGGLSDMPN